MNKIQCLHSVVAGHREISKNEVGVVSLEREGKVGLGVHTLDLAEETIGFQFAANQLGIEGVILQMQDVEWGLHQLCQERRSKRRDISGGGTLISDQKRPILCTVVWKSGKPTGLIT